MIYFMQPVGGGPVKIGYSSDVESRRGQLENIYGKPLVVLAAFEGDRDTERQVHERFSHIRFGKTEQFRPAPELMEFIGRPLLVSEDPDVVEAMDAVGLNPMIVQMRGSEEFKEYVQRGADFTRYSVAKATEFALIQYFRSMGFDEVPPKR